MPAGAVDEQGRVRRVEWATSRAAGCGGSQETRWEVVWRGSASGGPVPRTVVGSERRGAVRHVRGILRTDLGETTVRYRSQVVGHGMAGHGHDCPFAIPISAARAYQP